MRNPSPPTCRGYWLPTNVNPTPQFQQEITDVVQQSAFKFAFLGLLAQCEEVKMYGSLTIC